MIFEEIYKSTGLMSINEINVLKMNRMCISVDPSPNENYGNAEYFKVYNHIHPDKATKIARIKFRECGYVIHCNNGGKKNWELNLKENN